MRTAPSSHAPIAIAVSVLTAALWSSLVPVVASAQATPHPAKSFAQQLVDATHAAHPDVDEIGISVTTSRGCIGIASTDKSDIGEKCEADDIAAMKTGKASAGKEGTGYDVVVPLHDATGKMVGVVGVGFKGAPGQTAASVTAKAQTIANEMSAKIPSKAKLVARAN